MNHYHNSLYDNRQTRPSGLRRPFALEAEFSLRLYFTARSEEDAADAFDGVLGELAAVAPSLCLRSLTIEAL